ncbi:hypothetical protein EG68_03388 [Paragonimus skrjabini miyazakii]|uniref:SCP domain-containing protein n=1 Tax=Paragonimus skrjabini miyazakii TaxID=59628 RepID=A0A8S9Z653_9TREM|nr:hypothetical protein EG68_03388 [Paragonimus skrjabini miyazakii]
MRRSVFNFCVVLSQMLSVGVVFSQITPQWRKELLNLHNAARNQLRSCQVIGQPPVKQMPQLQWHPDLEAKAQQLADQCREGHDTDEERQISAFDYVGQNWAGSMDMKTAVGLWFDEYKYYDFNSGQCSQGMCGHYTQMAWAKTTHVGCGVRDCNGVGSFPYGLSIVCNYGPG